MFSKEINNNNGLIFKLNIILIVLYVFTIPFGTVFRSEDVMSVKPLINLSFLTYAILLFSAISAISTNSLKNHVVIKLLFLLSFYLLINTLLFSKDLNSNLFKWITFFGNVLLVFFVSNIKFKRSFLISLFNIIAIGALISSILTLVDHVGIINIPYFNERTIGVIGFDTRGISGPFQSRTNMGAFYSIIMPITLLSFLNFKKILYLISFAVSFIAMIATFNRSAPLVVIIVVIIYVFRKYSINIKTVLKIFVVSCISIIVLYNTFTVEQRMAIKYLFLSSLNLIEKDEVLADSDSFRIDAFLQIISYEIPRNPFGNGFNDFHIKGTKEPISVHSNLNYILYIAGVFGFFWLIYFLRSLYKTSRLSHIKELEIIKYSLFSWALYSLAHMVINTFLAWFFLGLLLNRYLNNEIEIKSVS